MANFVDKYWQKKFIPLKARITRHENRITAILTKAMENPQTSSVFWNTVRASINKEYTAIGATFGKWAKTNIPKAYRVFVRQQMARINNLKSITNKAKKSVNKLVNTNASRQIVAALTKDAISDMTAGLVQGNLRINRLTRLTQQTLVTEALVDSTVAQAFEAGNISLNTVLKRKGSLANSLVNQAKNGRFITVMDKNGNPRNYTARYYSEMVSRVKFHEAQAQGAIVTANNYDTDLVRVSEHNTTTAICQEFEGKIFSISGKDKRFPVISQVPPFHVNCLHIILATFVEALQAQGNLKGYSDFSKGKTNTPPNSPSFVPVNKRNDIISKTTTETKETSVYKSATTKQKRTILKDNVSNAIGAAA